MKILDCDYFIVGSGIAGLMSALHLCKNGKVLIATKKERAESNTNNAQGGIACVVASDDSFEEHIRDTLVAGAGLCDENVVRTIVSSGPERIAELEKFGLAFAEQIGGGYDLGKEGGHSKRRVLHSGDITGRKIEETLLARIHAEKNITILEHCMVIDLVTTGWLGLSGDNRCCGAYIQERFSGEIMAVRSPFVIL